MTRETHKIHLMITEIAEKHGIEYDLDTESRKILINFVNSVKPMGEDTIEMSVLAFLVGYDKGAKNHYLRRGT